MFLKDEEQNEDEEEDTDDGFAVKFSREHHGAQTNMLLRPETVVV